MKKRGTKQGRKERVNRTKCEGEKETGHLARAMCMHSVLKVHSSGCREQLQATTQLLDDYCLKHLLNLQIRKERGCWC